MVRTKRIPAAALAASLLTVQQIRLWKEVVGRRAGRGHAADGGDPSVLLHQTGFNSTLVCLAQEGLSVALEM